MRLVRAVTALPLCLMVAGAQTVDVGTGPFGEAVRQQFVQAFFRNNFQNLVTLPPKGNVRRFGPTGLVQEFQSATSNAETAVYALAKPDTSGVIVEGVNSVQQVSPNLYRYWQTVGATAAGYPNTDTQNCPVINNAVCEFQLYTNNYILFAYAATTVNGQNFSVRDPFSTRWRALGGAGALGPAISAEEAVTSGAGSGITATVQRFASGAIYNITSGNLNGRVATVTQPILDLYLLQGGDKAFLGLPTGDEVRQPDNRRRQTFEGGAIEYFPGQDPVLRLPVATVVIRSVGTVLQRVNLGDVFRLEASTFAGNGAALDSRAITWRSSNTRVLAVDAAGAQVTVRAVGGGTATITAVSEGIASRAISYFVTAPCCQVGEGAPTAAVQQAFVDAVTRNRLAVRIPSPSPVRRAGNGLIQELVSDADPNVRFLVAKADSQARAYVVGGSLLARYTALGGPAGAVGYPLGDPSPRGRQVFEFAALAGDPVQAVTGAILTRWAAQNYEDGRAGLPAGPVESVLSFVATLGAAQPFSGGLFVSHATGSLSGRAFLVSGLILARYLAAGGPQGRYGFPVGDQFDLSGRTKQDFEGAVIDFAPGDTEARVDELDRRPRISATPSVAAAGSRVRLAAGGFDTGATLRIKVGDEPEFLAATETGAFAWEILVPANAPSGIVQLRAAQANGSALAVGSYTIQAASETIARVTKIRGDLQTGLPGARLPQPLRIAVKDENGQPLAGIAVRFSPSPGAQIEDASTVTDARGEAQAFLRLPLAQLPALATAEASRQVVTFSAIGSERTLRDYPRFSQAGETGDTALGNESATIARKGALLVSSASMIRYLQNEGLLTASNGQADPLVLNSYLKDLCIFDAAGQQVCDGFTAPPGASENNVNLWRLASFVAGNLDLEPLETREEAIRDALAEGSPVLVGLTLSTGGAVAGSHFVVAIGVAANGGIVVHDPNPALSRLQLGDYLGGFSVQGTAYTAQITAALRFQPRTPSALGFLIATRTGLPLVSSTAGRCGFTVTWPDIAVTGGPVTAGAGPARFTYCDGERPFYQLDVSGTGRDSFLLTDLGTTAGRFLQETGLPAAYRLVRPASNWTAEPLTLDFQPDAVVNAATFLPDLAGGTIAAVFGSGLSFGGQETAARLDGDPVAVLSSSAFQVNLHIPPGTAPGRHILRLESAFGSVERTITTRAVAPAIFVLPGGGGAILNQNGSINAAANPALRGQVIVIYATGLGDLEDRGGLQWTREPVTVSVSGRQLAVVFAGAAPGFPGLYQINVVLPADLAPGLGSRLLIQQAGAASNAVTVSVR